MYNKKGSVRFLNQNSTPSWKLNITCREKSQSWFFSRQFHLSLFIFSGNCFNLNTLLPLKLKTKSERSNCSQTLPLLSTNTLWYKEIRAKLSLTIGFVSNRLFIWSVSHYQSLNSYQLTHPLFIPVRQPLWDTRSKSFFSLFNLTDEAELLPVLMVKSGSVVFLFYASDQGLQVLLVKSPSKTPQWSETAVTMRLAKECAGLHKLHGRE